MKGIRGEGEVNQPGLEDWPRARSFSSLLQTELVYQLEMGELESWE